MSMLCARWKLQSSFYASTTFSTFSYGRYGQLNRRFSTFHCRNTLCPCHSKATAFPGLLSALRRVLREARCIDSQKRSCVLLSEVIKPHQVAPLEGNTFYKNLLQRNLKTSLYAIPQPGHRPLAADILQQCRAEAKHWAEARCGTPASPQLETQESFTDVLLGGLFVTLRRLRWIQAFVKGERPPMMGEEVHKSSASSPDLLCSPQALHSLDQAEYSNITSGVFLLAHPLATGLWREAIILITQKQTKPDGTVLLKGVIINRPRPFWDRRISGCFVRTLKSVFASATTSGASSRVLRDLLSIDSELPLSTPGTTSQLRNTFTSHRSDLKRLWRKQASFGGPLPDVVTLHQGSPQHSARVVIPQEVTTGWEIPSSPPEPSTSRFNSPRRLKMRHKNRQHSQTNLAPSKHFAPESTMSRHFLGAAVWDAEQLKEELDEGHWLPFRVSDRHILRHLLWGTEIPVSMTHGTASHTHGTPDNLWKELLRILSNDLYRFMCLPQRCVDQARYQASGHLENDAVPKLAAFLAPFLDPSRDAVIVRQLLDVGNASDDPDEQSDDAEDAEEAAHLTSLGNPPQSGSCHEASASEDCHMSQSALPSMTESHDPLHSIECDDAPRIFVIQEFEDSLINDDPSEDDEEEDDDDTDYSAADGDDQSHSQPIADEILGEYNEVSDIDECDITEMSLITETEEAYSCNEPRTDRQRPPASLSTTCVETTNHAPTPTDLHNMNQTRKSVTSHENPTNDSHHETPSTS